jgi:hypothetical protein
MANKLGLLNGIILLILNFISILPLGLYIASGIQSYAGITMNFMNYNSIEVYSWGVIDNNTIQTLGWLDIPNGAGLVGFIIIQIMLICACVLSILSGFTSSKAGKIGLVISSIMIIIPITYILIDALVFGALFAGSVIPLNQLFGFLDMGFYLLFISLIIGLFAIKIHKKD